MFLLRCRATHSDCESTGQTVPANPDVAGIGVRPSWNTLKKTAADYFLGSSILCGHDRFGDHLRLHSDNTRIFSWAFGTKTSSQSSDGKNPTTILILVECLQEDSPRVKWYTIAHRTWDAGDGLVSPLHHRNILLLDRYQLGISFDHHALTDNGGFEELFHWTPAELDSAACSYYFQHWPLLLRSLHIGRLALRKPQSSLGWNATSCMLLSR